ncbi:MAG: DNA adenine methylase [Candidatus Acidiferrales bacterium]
MQNLSPLRYPGGKARLAAFVQNILRMNRLCDAHYVEPYAGGASVALALLFNEYVSHIYINDADPAIFAFWHSVLHETDALCRRIGKANLTITTWRRQRALQQNPENSTLLQLGFSTLFLNRTNRSGIIRSAGAIGGLRQQGKWKLDARFYRDTLIHRIQAIAAYRERITLTNLDAAAFLAAMAPRLPAKSLIYLDPPYYVKGKRRLYANHYEHADHAEIAALLVGCKHPWLVSYDDVPEIRRLYKGYRRKKYRLSYTAQERYEGAEIVFFSHGLYIGRGLKPIHSAEDLSVA